jgi:hypothetical protein
MTLLAAASAATRRRRRRSRIAPLGMPDLAAITAPLGGTLVGGWHQSTLVRDAANVVSAWRPTYGGFPLAAFGDPVYEPDTQSVALDAASSQCFQGGGAGLNVLTDSMAVVVVATKPTNAAAAARLVVVSQDLDPAFMVAEYSHPATNDLLDLYATGISGSLVEIDVTAMAARQAIHIARSTDGAAQHFYLRRARGVTSHGDFAGGGATTGAANRLTIGANREVPPSTKFCTIAELSAVLVFDLADGAGYSDALATAVNDWCETYAGAVP